MLEAKKIVNKTPCPKSHNNKFYNIVRIHIIEIFFLFYSYLQVILTINMLIFVDKMEHSFINPPKCILTPNFSPNIIIPRLLVRPIYLPRKNQKS